MRKTYSILGCGWLGFELAKYFITQDNIVHGSTTSADKMEQLEAEHILPFLVDITNNDSKELETFLQAEVLVIAITSKDVSAFVKLIDAIERSPITKVIFISSTSVYPSLNSIVTESHTTVNSPLRSIECLFSTNTKFKTTIIRFAGLYGGNRHPGNWFTTRKIPNPLGYVNMIHRDDCIAIIAQLIDNNIFGTVFNACTTHHPTRLDFYKNARKSLGKEHPDFESDEVLSYKIISSEKLIQYLNYSFKHTDLLNL